MVKAATCESVFQGHCNHWGLTEGAHALVHAQMRRLNEVAEQDTAAGLDIRDPDAGSVSSVVDDGPRLEALLADEGYHVVPMVGSH